MSPAAALLRRLDAEATGAPWVSDSPGAEDADVRTGDDMLIVCERPRPTYDGHFAWVANARSICTTRNLLEHLAVLVEAAASFDAADAAVRAKQDEADLDLMRRCEPEWFANRDALKSALASLEAAAAKEGV